MNRTTTRRRVLCRWLAFGLLTIAATTGVAARADGPATDGLATECEYAPNGPTHVVVGAVECLRFDSEMMGGKEPFSYYVPPACAPETGRRCPVLYWLHGLGGSYRSGDVDGLGPRGTTDSPWIRALTSGPPVDPRAVANPWHWADTNLWLPRAPVDLIIVTPHGQTLPGGNGPGADRSTGWVDFNPRYARDGDQPRYNTPPPRSESMIVDELIPYVEDHLPAIKGRSGRTLGGVSYGGIGTGLIGLHHPDMFSALHMNSGVGFPWPQPGAAAGPDGLHVASPTPAPVYVPAPGVQPYIDSTGLVPLIFLGSYGDGMTSDNAYARWNNPADLVGNAHAIADGKQVVHLRFTVNDGVPRRLEDDTDPFTPIASGLEVLVATGPGPLMDHEATRLGVAHEFVEGPGVHSAPYWRPYLREAVESMYAQVRHWDGGGNAFANPDVFDYRTIAKQFSIWGWPFSVEREPLEFLNLSDVTCRSVTLRGSGLVTFTVPTSCGTGVDGSNLVHVDLGASTPVNEPYGAGSSQTYGNAVTIGLSPIS